MILVLTWLVYLMECVVNIGLLLAATLDWLLEEWEVVDLSSRKQLTFGIAAMIITSCLSTADDRGAFEAIIASNSRFDVDILHSRRVPIVSLKCYQALYTTQLDLCFRILLALWYKEQRIMITATFDTFCGNGHRML